MSWTTRRITRKAGHVARSKTTLTVLRTESLTPHMVRVYLGDPGFDDFEPVDYADSYVKLIFGPEDDEVKRTYTIRTVDTAAREIAIDFVVHGDEGVAGPWAASVQPGASISLYGPAGAYSPRSDADWHLFAGDESAIPAISAAVEKLSLRIAKLEEERAVAAKVLQSFGAGLRPGEMSAPRLMTPAAGLELRARA